MALFGDFIYFSDWKNKRSLMRISKFCTVGCEAETVTSASADKARLGISGFILT